MGKRKYTTPKENSSWFKKGCKAWSKGLTKETDLRVAKRAEKMKKTKRERWKDPEYRKIQGEKLRKAKVGTKQTKESNEKRSKTQRGRKKHPGFGAKISKALKGRQFSEDWLKKNSEGVKRAWQNPEYVAKQMIARGVKPNKPEKFLDELFQHFYPNLWKYTGDGKDKDFIVAGKSPDFVHTKEKKIIEFFGTYWHGESRTGISIEQHEQERIDLFAQHGYQTLIIWEHELKDIEKLLNKLREFSNKKRR